MLIALMLAVAQPACIARVHDGDTVTLCSGERVRLADIDAPELSGSPRCRARQRQRLAGSKNPAWCDYRLGERARDVLARMLASGHVTIARNGRDRYGRTLARLYVGGRAVGPALIRRGLARAWVK